MIENISLLRLAIAMALMTYAAVLDWKTRRVANWVWVFMGSLGMCLLFIEDPPVFGPPGSTIEYNFIHMLILIPIGIFFFDVFWDREPLYEKGKINFLAITLYAIGFIIMGLIVYSEGFTDATMILLSIPIMILVFLLFYYAKLIHGGADAKAFMALAIMFPYYPVVMDFPIIQGPDVTGLNIAFPFAFLILMNAAILQVVTVPLGMFFKNLANKDYGFPEMFLGYRMDIDDVSKNFVWPMQKIIDGEEVLVIFPKRGGNIEDDLKPLREIGTKRLWVTPKVPFIIPMLLGIIFSVIIGNLVMLMF